ncbi:hypothetical protein [Archangium sp.]|uniref:hypothetical protein n=1 Tax=Archangium sp. TaxID=1872627 RepID=UPI00286A2944|nr:hypothetical protein [Archangium sp.]
MDEKKKSEASGEESDRLGSYVIQEQVQQSHDKEGLYLATHETSGATGLLREHSAEERAAQGKSWRVLLECWASEGYSVLHVQFTDWARALDRQSAESLLHTLEAVLEEVRRMLHAASCTPEPRARWHLGWGVAGAVLVCALLLALVYRVPVPQRLSAPPAPMRHEVPTATETSDFRAWLADTTPEGQTVLARPLPKEPFKGQKRPPCTRYTEVELVGACWAPHKLKAPCPEDLFDYQGECYMPSFSAKPPPSSLGQ